MIYAIILLIILAVGTYFYFLHKGKIKDEDGDFIPDVVEERVQRVKEELKDVKEAVKEVGNQIGDIPSAVKGKTRTGRKPKK